MKQRRTHLALAALAAAATVLGACGAGTSTGTAETTPAAAAPGRTVTVRMTDNAFEPTTIAAATGETVSFEFVNDGKIVHEAYVGSEKEQEDHAAEMQAAGAHGMHMADDDLVRVDPGATAGITKTFDDAGTVVIGCHQPGHWEAGMKATVTVT